MYTALLECCCGDVTAGDVTVGAVVVSTTVFDVVCVSAVSTELMFNTFKFL